MTVMLRLVLAGALLPIPIGVGLRYHPRPAAHGRCAPGSLTGGRRVHLELFANRRVVIVPAAIGLRDPQFSNGRALSARCHAALWTGDPSGVVHYARPATLERFFRVWGEPLASLRLLSFRGVVRVYRNGVRVDGDPRRVLLRDRDELVLEVGGYVPPHRAYRFPR